MTKMILIRCLCFVSILSLANSFQLRCFSFDCPNPETKVCIKLCPLESNSCRIIRRPINYPPAVYTTTTLGCSTRICNSSLFDINFTDRSINYWCNQDFCNEKNSKVDGLRLIKPVLNYTISPPLAGNLPTGM